MSPTRSQTPGPLPEGQARGDDMRETFVVVGLDGATWHYLDPLIEAGRLPTLSQLREGLSCELDTIRPPVSCPAWFSYGTGQDPSSLGLWGWRNFDRQAPSLKFNSYDDLDEPEIWDHLSHDGLESAVINIPTAFPPKRIDGYMVSGMQAEERQTYTQPPGLKRELRDRFDYKVAPDHKMRWDPEQTYEEILELVPKRFQAARHLLDDVDLLHVTVFHIDEIQHEAWDTPRLAEAWETIDAELGRFLDDLPEDTNLVVMSDHGFGPVDWAFNVNSWLIEEGLLALESDWIGQALEGLGLTRERLERLLRRAGLLNAAKGLVPRGLQTRVPERDGGRSAQRRLPRIDWEDTVAFAPSDYTLYAEEGHVDEIKARLEGVQTPDGDPVFEEIQRPEDRFEQVPDNAPDLLLLPRRGIGLDDPLGAPVWRRVEDDSGDHRPEGLLALQGPAFDASAQLEGARLVDLAPTILHAMGCPVPRRMDGRVLDVLSTDRAVEFTTEDATRSGYTEEELEDVEERLRGLGYLGPDE